MKSLSCFRKHMSSILKEKERGLWSGTVQNDDTGDCQEVLLCFLASTSMVKLHSSFELTVLLKLSCSTEQGHLFLHTG